MLLVSFQVFAGGNDGMIVFLIDFQFFGVIVECHSSVVVISLLASNAIGYLS